MAILALKIFLTLWSLGWFGILGVAVWNESFDETVSLVFGWLVAVIVVHSFLILSFGLFSWIWFVL